MTDPVVNQWTESFLNKPTSGVLKHESRVRQTVILGVGLICCAMLMPMFVYYAVRIGSAVPIDYNEGWSVIHTSRLLGGENLYRSNSNLPVAPVNYPPLWFFIIAGIGYFTDNLLVVGRGLSFGALLCVAYFILRTVSNITLSSSSGLLGAVLWLVFLTHVADLFIGMHDPQLLAHAFSTGALCLASGCSEEPKATQVWIIAGLCCIAIFIKHLVVAVPVALAVTFLFTNLKLFWRFTTAGVALFASMFAIVLLYGGEHFLLNLIELDRPASNWQRLETTRNLFLRQSGWLLLVPPIMLMWGSNDQAGKSKIRLVLVYFFVALGLGAYVSGGVGVYDNSWFDFFIAACILFGVASADRFAGIGMPALTILRGTGLITAGLALSGLIAVAEVDEPIARYSLRVLQFAVLARGVVLLRRTKRAAVVFGVCLIASAILANEVALARYLSADGILSASTVHGVRWFQLTLLVCGIVLAGERLILPSARALFYRQGALVSRTAPKLAALGIYGVLMLGLASILMGLGVKLTRGLSYRHLEALNAAYEKDTELLRSIHGPALFNNLLLGFDAGKKLWFDPFSGSVLIASGRVPEEVLVDPISQKSFAVIVTTSKIEELAAELRRNGVGRMTVAAYFNGSIIDAIQRNYELAAETDDLARDADGKRLKTLDGRGTYQHYFYLPRRDGVH